MLTPDAMNRLIALLIMSLLLAGCAGITRPAPQLPPGVHLDTLADKRAAFAQAYDAYRRGDDERARSLFTALLTTYPELADYHLYFAGLVQQHLGQNGAAEGAFSQLLRDYPQSLKAPAAEVELGKLFVHSGRIDEGRSWLRLALGVADSENAARFALAEADELSGDVRAAHDGFMTVRRAAPFSALARPAKQRVITLRAQHAELEPGGTDLLDDARLLVAEHDHLTAKAAVERLAERAEAVADSRVETSDVMRVLADALFGLGETERALAVLRRIVDLYPATTAAPLALARLATVRWNRDEDAAALGAFEEFLRRYPHHERAAEALYAIGRIHERAERTRAAIASYTNLSERYARSKLAAEARWRIGWIQYESHNWSTAANTFATLASRRRGRQRNAAAYWQARALESAGQRTAAMRLFGEIITRDRNDYYAMLAEQRLGKAAARPASDAAAGVLTPPEPAVGPAPFADRFHVDRWQELKATGVYGLARGELAFIEREHRDDRAVAGYVFQAYQTVDGYAAALRLLHRLGRRVDLAALDRERLEYPLAFWAFVRRDAQADGVDPFLVVAIMRQESAFDPDAHSPADAHGLMQLLPSTAQRVATANDGVVERSALTDPDVSVRLGVRYLAALLTRFHGDVLKAVAAYNGGENAVEKWQRRFADLDPDEFVESITYRETRDYVKRVMSNYRTYRQLYGESTP